MKVHTPVYNVLYSLSAIAATVSMATPGMSQVLESTSNQQRRSEANPSATIQLPQAGLQESGPDARLDISQDSVILQDHDLDDPIYQCLIDWKPGKTCHPEIPTETEEPGN